MFTEAKQSKHVSKDCVMSSQTRLIFDITGTGNLQRIWSPDQEYELCKGISRSAELGSKHRIAHGKVRSVCR